MTPLHVFQLEGHEVVLQLVNAQLAQPTNAMAQALHVPLNCIEALHIMPLAPDGFPELAIPAIVQRVGDLDLHSTDRLILIDTIYHHHPDPSGLTNSPTVVRAVQRVSCQVTRQQILFKAAVYHYCQYLQEGCAVSLDGYLWPINHVDPRPVSHGSYATVDVPPPYGHQLDTRMVADQLHDDGTMNTMMNWLTEPDDMPEDAMQLTQIFAAKRVVNTTTKHRIRWACRDCPLPNDADVTDDSEPLSTQLNEPHDQCYPLRHGSSASASHHAGSLPQLLNTHNESHTNPHGEIEQPGHLHAKPIASQAKLPMPKGQTKLHHFFTKRNQEAKPANKKTSASGQTTLHAFFARARTNPCPSPMHAEANHDLHDDPQQVAGTEVSFGNICTDAIDHKCSASQEVQPPVFTTTRPVQPALPQPRPPPRPAWRIHLANIFEEMATVVHRETGPVMQVEVWYIHHRDFPECVAPRALELDNIQELWYADLCNIWFDRIQRHEPLRVVNVLPTPPHQARPRSVAHLILEQGFSPDRIAVHFTAIFLGGTHLGLFQRVESSPTRICTRDMIVKHGFQLQCDFRPCNMHSGLLRFAMDEPEEVFSGISAVLTVAPPPPEPLTMHMQLTEGQPDLQDHEPLHDVNALMQQPIPPKRPPAGIRPADTTTISVHSPAPLFDHRMTPAALTEFRATLMWQLGIQAGRCRTPHEDHFQVHTWYLNSDTCTRTEVSRVVQLWPQPHTWHQDIVERWVDRLDTLYPVQLHVVTPNPPNISLAPEAHVIVLQRPNPLWRSALLSVLQPRSDPWHIQFVCAMLDAETSLEQLGFISGVSHPSNPSAHLSGIVAKQGLAQLPRDGTFPVRHGYWFDIQAYSLEDHIDDEVATIQLHFTTIRKLIGGIQHHVSLTAQTSMSPGMDLQDPAMPTALTVTVSPNDPGTFVDPYDALPFFTALQSHWQPLALLQPPELPALVPVITWYIDHIRFPQCFQPRLVLLNHNPADWIQRLRSVWVDLILPQQLMHVHIVQPPPPEMPMHVAAHLLIVQQPIEQFRAVLITTYDSALPDEPPINHASITPTPVAFSTVIALAYRDTVCQHPNVDCAVWVGEEELPQPEERPVINGHSLVVAVHRHHQPMPAGETEWELAQMHHGSGSYGRTPPLLPMPSRKCQPQFVTKGTESSCSLRPFFRQCPPSKR